MPQTSLQVAHLRATPVNSVGEQRPLGSRVAIGMLRAAIVMCLAAPVAAADPFAWVAPAGCPDVTAVQERAEQRLGATLDGVDGVEVLVTRERGGFTARIDARAITVANDVRTLRSRRCDALADAVAVVLARLASEVRVSRASTMAPTTVVAMVEPLRPIVVVDDLEDEMSGQVIADDEPTRPRPPRWGIGMSLLGLSGVGALPEVNLGGEVAVFVRRAKRFVSLGASRWVPQNARIAPGAPGGVEIRLDTLTVRAGWSPPTQPLRAWLLAELGQIQGTGVGFDAERTAETRWTALGAGLGVGWPMTEHARLVGTFEIAIPLERPRFMLAAGSDLYQPGAMAARCAFGLEVGWP